MPLSQRELDIRRRLRDDFPHYASRCLKIRPKKGGTVPLALNKAQLYIHERLERQRKEKGRVRAVILKGRQQGASTYIEGRFFWRVTHTAGSKAVIITHRQDSTDNLFKMTERYYEHCPELVRPHKGTSNAKELAFDQLDSSYATFTAGGREIGRGDTIQFLHGSEVAFWPNAADHLSGALQAVPEEDNTEVILESTANGIGNAFHKAWQDAESGKSDFEAIFVPWFWQPEYTRLVPDDFELTEEEIEYRDLHRVSDSHMVWRRAKIVELLGDEDKFRQEYPATAAEAFQQSGKFSLIKPAFVLRARKATFPQSDLDALVIGVDLGGLTSEDIIDDNQGDDTDNATIIYRQGRKMFNKEKIPIIRAMAMVGKLSKILDDDDPDMMFVDLGNGGHILVDRLYELGYRKKVTGVNFGGSPIREDAYMNKRAEMWDTMRLWFEDDGGCDCPDDDEFQADVTSIRKKEQSHHRKMVLESKADMRRRGLRSPDVGDASAMTFAFPVMADKPKQHRVRHGKSRPSYNPLNYRP